MTITLSISEISQIAMLVITLVAFFRDTADKRKKR